MVPERQHAFELPNYLSNIGSRVVNYCQDMTAIHSLITLDLSQKGRNGSTVYSVIQRGGGR